MSTEIGDLLYQLRYEANLSQDEVAIKMGITSQTISNYERNICQPKISDFCRLLEIYGKSVCIL